MPPTPVPALQLSILCISIFSELLSASLAAPFLYPMISSFDLGSTHSNRPAVKGYYCGLLGPSSPLLTLIQLTKSLGSAFFLAQFLTGVLWVSLATRYGRRSVLVISLAGNGLSLMAFGTCGTLRTAVGVRLLQGFFNGLSPFLAFERDGADGQG